jgi:DNA polymerase (family 10)
MQKLVRYDEINGDFHVHSIWSDGNDSIETIASVAQQRGYSFISITDHSQSLKIANGLNEPRIQQKINEIKKIQKKFPTIRIFCGTECDIKTDGSLDYNNRILKQFDFVYIGIHTGFKMDKETRTKRIIKAMDNESVNFLAHPTGRIIGRRDPYDINIEQIFDASKETGTLLEINSFPDRLDLNDIHIKLAKERGLQFVLGTDSHNINHLNFMRFGIATARRGWLEKKDIINTKSLNDIEKIIGD